MKGYAGSSLSVGVDVTCNLHPKPSTCLQPVYMTCVDKRHARPFSHFVANVKNLFCDVTQHVCATLQVTSAATDRPKPVYKSTACQLGIHKTAGVWPLLDSLLPPAPTSLLVRRWLRRLLLLPPPTEVAKSIRTACQFLSGNSQVSAAVLQLSQLANSDARLLTVRKC